MSGNLTNPLQLIIDQASQLSDTGQAKQYQQRVEPNFRNRVSESQVLILDISGSMAQRISGSSDRKIDILERVVFQLPWQNYHVLLFNSETQWWFGGGMPPPSGGTAMHLALSVAKEMRPKTTLVVSDGEPDEDGQALAVAKQITGVINTLYIGSDGNHEAIEFMRKLARLGCGHFHDQDLSLGDQPLLAQMQRLLPGGNA